MDKYKVLKRIGVGTYGSAYLVCSKHNQLEQFVLKKVKLDEANEKEYMQAQMEVTVLASLDHPLVLGYVDHFMYKQHLCIVTDYCESGDIYSLLRTRKSPLMEGQLLEWLVQIVLAIQYVHAKNILHRDLKTQNIFLTKDNNIMLGDFGISRSLNSTVDLASTIIGTPYYMSPEVMSSMPYDFKSDMWSLGCCVYEMMSLKHAFDAQDMTGLVLKIMRGEHLPIPSHFSPDLRDLVKQLLSKNPKQRPSTEQILKLPFLKEYVLRAKEKVAWMEQQKRKRSGSQTTTSGRQQVRTNGSSNGGSHPKQQQQQQQQQWSPIEGSNLDRELDMAKQRLRRIQLERDALREQVNAVQRMTEELPPSVGAASAPGGSPPRRSSQPQVPLSKGPSMRGREDRMQRLHHLASNSSTKWLQGLGADDATPRLPLHLGEDAGIALERHKELRHVRSSREQSPEHHDATAAILALDPKARKEVRKAEELRRREAELLEVRKAYFEERKQAEAKKWQLYHGSTAGSTSLKGAPPRHGGGHMRTASIDRDQTKSMPGNGLPPQRISGTGIHEVSSAFMAADPNGLSVMDSSEDELDEELQAQCMPLPSLEGSAAHEFELEVSTPASTNHELAAPLMRTFDAGAAVSDRIMALRNICIANLGQPLFDLLHGAMRKRLAARGSGILTADDDQFFWKELMNRLGPSRMQYVHICDQLVYFEELAGL